MSEIDETFRHYRQGSLGISATVIGLCTGMLIYFENQTSENIDYSLRLIVEFPLIITIILSLFIQHFHYKGYGHKAHSDWIYYLISEWEENERKKELSNAAKEHFYSANLIFSKQERVVGMTWVLFSFSSLIYFLWHFSN